MPYLFLPEERYWGYRPPPKTIVVAGIAGQDGSYLAEYLVALGHRVHGLVRRDPDERLVHLDLVRDRIELHRVDLQDQRALVLLLEKVEPDRVFNLAGVEPSPDSLLGHVHSAEANGLTAVKLLEAIRLTDPGIRYFQASASAILAPAGEEPLGEESAIRPATAFGCGKALAHHATAHFRDRYGLFAVNGILFPHTSPRQSGRRLVRRITFTAANARLGDPAETRVGQLDRRLDVGFAGDVAEAMWTALQVARPADYVIGTGVGRTVREVIETAFAYAEVDWEPYVKTDPSVVDPEADDRIAATARSECALGWRPKVPFEQLVQAMIVSEFYRLEAVRKDPRRYVNSTTAAGVRGPRPNWPLGRERRRLWQDAATG